MFQLELRCDTPGCPSRISFNFGDPVSIEPRLVQFHSLTVLEFETDDKSTQAGIPTPNIRPKRTAEEAGLDEEIPIYEQPLQQDFDLPYQPIQEDLYSYASMTYSYDDRKPSWKIVKVGSRVLSINEY